MCTSQLLLALNTLAQIENGRLNILAGRFKEENIYGISGANTLLHLYKAATVSKIAKVEFTKITNHNR